MTTISADTAQLAAHRAAILAPLVASARCSRAAAQAAAADLGLSERQVFVLVRRLRQAQGNTTVLQVGRSDGGRGKSRLSSAAETAIQRAIAARRDIDSATDVIAAIRNECRKQKIPAPAPATIRRRLKLVSTSKASADTPLPRCSARPPGRLILPPDTDLRLLTSLYDSVGRPDGWGGFLHHLAETYPGGHGALVVHDQAMRNGWMQVGSHWEPHVYTDYNRYYVTRNPWIPHLAKRPVGQAMFPDHFVPKAELAATEFYNDLLRPVRIDTAIGVTLQRDGSRFMDVSVLLSHANAERDPDAVGRLQRLVPHLLRVAQLNRQLAGLELRTAAAEAALDRLDTAVLVVNGAGRVMHMNPAAERLAAMADGLTVVQGVLSAISHGETQGLRRLVSEASQVPRDVTAVPGGVMRINRRSGATAYEVLVAPLSENALSPGFSGPLAAVFVRDPETRIRIPIEWLRHLYGLTGAEARLMQGLLAGNTLDAIAEQVGVGKETLRSQLKSVFLKTGTGSQAALLRLGLRGLGAFQR